MSYWKTFVREIRIRKDGLIIGGIVGAIAAYVVALNGQNLETIAAAGKGLADSLFTRSAAIEMAQYKLYAVFILLGALIGGLAEEILVRLGAFGRRSRRR